MEERIQVKTNLEHEKKSMVLTLVGVSFVALIICVIVAAAASPEVIGKSSLNFPLCSNDRNVSCYYDSDTENMFVVHIDLEKYNQFLYLFAEFESGNNLNLNLNYSLVIYGNDDGKSEILKYENKNFDIDCNDGNCEPQVLFYIPYISYTNYSVILTVFGNLQVDEMKLSIKFITKEFTKFLLGTKYFFLTLSIINIVLFVFNLIRMSSKFWQTQTKLLVIMAGSLIIFNEPFLALTLTKLTSGWSGLSVVSYTQFASLLLIFFFLILQNDLEYKYWLISLIAESVLVFIFFVLVNVVYMYTTEELKYDPTFSWENDLTAGKRSVFVAVVVFLVIFSVWIVFLAIFTLAKIIQKTLREQVMILSVLFMLIATLILIGFGAFQPLSRSGTLLLITVSLYNWYFYIMFWLYTPSHESYNEFMSQETQRIESDNRNVTITGNDDQMISNKI